MDASGMGKVLADFIHGLYWLVGIMFGLLVLAIAVIIWLVVSR
jgi:hypothetical protein